MTLEALEDRTLLSNPATTADLIAAINSANNSGSATTITLAAGTTFDFTSAIDSTNGANALPAITGNITIVGNNDTIERTGSSAFRLFDVAKGGSLTLQDLTLQGGWALGSGLAAEGGAVYSSGTLNLSGVTIRSNKAQGSSPLGHVDGANAFGGGLYVVGGSVSLSNDTLSNNTASGANGGAIVGGNGGNAGGGAVYVTATNSVSLSNCTLSGNAAIGGQGGAGRNGARGGSGGNGGVAVGGGVEVLNASSVTLSNDTLSFNVALGGFGGNGGDGRTNDGGNGGEGAGASGGGFYVAAGSLILSNDTLSSNFAVGGSGGSGGNGGTGAKGGIGGSGGSGTGGGGDVNASSVSLSNDTLSGNIVHGGDGSNGGKGGNLTGNAILGSVAGAGGAGGFGGEGTGGGLFVLASSVSLSNDTVSGNVVQGGFGGNGGNGGTASVTFGGAGGVGRGGGSGMGGGLFVNADSVILSNDTVSGNVVQGGFGGNGGNGDSEGGAGGSGGAGGDAFGGGLDGFGLGLSVNADSDSLSNDTVSGNVVQGGDGGNGGHGGSGDSEGGAGGVGGQGGDVLGGGMIVSVNSSLNNDTFGGNNAQGGHGGHGGIGGDGATFFGFNGTGGNGGNGGRGGGGTGGGLFIEIGSVTLANTLIAENSVAAGTAGTGGLGGAGVEVGVPGAPGSASIGSAPDVFGEVDSSDHDLIGNTSGSLGFSKALGDILNPSFVGLGPLADNDGPTQTMALLPGSPAIDAGDSSAPGLPATDQRGFARVVGNAVDIGAYEFGATAATTNLLISGSALSSAAPGGQLTYTLTVTNNSSTAQSNVTLTDLLPANTTLVSWTGAPGWSSDAPPPGSSSGTVSAWIDSLPANSSATFTLVVQVNSNTPLQTIINNTVSIAPAANLSNSSASFSTTVLYTPTFSNLTVQQIIVGTSTTTVSGQLAYNTIIPVGQSVSITLNGVTQVGTVATDGSFSVNFATGSLGVGTYAITYSYAGDNDFAPASGTGSLTVAYGSQLLFNNSKPKHSGAALPIKLALTDANGADISSANIAVTAVGLVDSSGNAVPLNAEGNANPNDLFRYDASLGGYIFNLSTKGLAAGTYTLYFTADNDPTRHSLTFVVD